MIPIREAAARGYCHPKNSHKELDADLLDAICEEIAAQVMARLEDHYWDSLADQKDMILNHVKGALQIMPKGPAGDRGQVGWMGGEYDR